MQGRILPSEYSLISLFMISFTYWCWPCLWRRWRSWNPAMVLFSSYSLMGLILSTCHHCTHTDRKKPFSYNTGGYYGFFHILFSILQKLVYYCPTYRFSKAEKAFGFSRNNAWWTWNYKKCGRNCEKILHIGLYFNTDVLSQHYYFIWFFKD